MLFNSFQFLVFFVLVTGFYFILPHRFRWGLLLVASCWFYMSFVPIYILILIFTIAVDYSAGRLMEHWPDRRKKGVLFASLFANIGTLGLFKYYGFINGNLAWLLHPLGLQSPFPELSLLLPIGLSFHTFQAMSYTLEVYAGRQKAEKHPGRYALYVMFYPQLVAGPIERPGHLLPQFMERHVFDYDRVTSGLRLMAWGLFKKAVIADRLAVVVDTVYGAPDRFNSLSLAVATLFFSFQIFCDFSGYCDMAIGAARVMGFRLVNNFNRPYHAASVAEFWKRWHISLSTWFRDYLYIPLGGNRVSLPRWVACIGIVFLVSGLWHGANWCFVIWGGLHGAYLITGRLVQRSGSRLARLPGVRPCGPLSVLVTFFLVTAAWVFFRAGNLDTAFLVFRQGIEGIPLLFRHLLQHRSVFEYIGVSRFELVLSGLLILLLETIHFVQPRIPLTQMFLRAPAVLRWTVYVAVVLSILVLGVFEDRPFIYFQF
ncbi:MAG: MBOAT family O-acyltransferase [Fibrobacterota bacterium]